MILNTQTKLGTFKDFCNNTTNDRGNYYSEDESENESDNDSDNGSNYSDNESNYSDNDSSDDYSEEFSKDDPVYKITSCGDIIGKDTMIKWLNKKTTCPKCGTDLSKIMLPSTNFNSFYDVPGYNSHNNINTSVIKSFDAFTSSYRTLFKKIPIIKQYDPLSNSYICGEHRLNKLSTPSGFYKRY